MDMHRRAHTRALWRARWLALVVSASQGMVVPAQTPVPVAPRAAVIPGAIMPNYRAIVQLAAPAVVGITVTGSRKVSPQDWLPWPNEEPLSSLLENVPRGTTPGERAFHGQGSGFIITADGLVLTSAHVIQGVEQILVQLSDRREFKAQVLGADPLTDAAVLRVAASNLPTVRLGRVDDLQVGDPVLAIGAPYGLEQTATQGIVSAKGRALPGESLVMSVASDSAARSAGLMAGDVITSVNGQRIDNAGELGARLAQLSPGGTVQLTVWRNRAQCTLSVVQGRAFDDTAPSTQKSAAAPGQLGLNLRPLTREEREAASLDSGGLMVVDSSDPAARAGLVAGDALLAVNGTAVSSVEQVRAMVARKLAAVALLIERDGDRLLAPVELD